MQSAISSRAVVAPAVKGLVWALLAGVSAVAAAASNAALPKAPATPVIDSFRPEFRQLVRVSCPSGGALPRPLIDAAACGDAFRVRIRLAEGADPAVQDARPGLEGRTALHHAVQLGDLESVRLLVEAGADVNARDAQGNTPLHLLAQGERGLSELDIARVLLRAGADARIRNGRDATPLGALIVSGWYRIDPLRLSPLPLASVLDEAEATGPLQLAATSVSLDRDVSGGVPPSSGDAQGEAPGEAVRAALTQWAAAWAARDIDGYLGHYAPDFIPSDGKALDAWQAQRRARIGGAKVIEVVLSDVAVTVEGDRAVADFTQDYRSDSYRSSDRKRVVMRHAAGRWQIVEEAAAR